MFTPEFSRRARTLVLPVVSGGMFLFAVYSVIQPGRTQADPPVRPPVNAYADAVAGIGTIEPQSELIAVASELNGVVRKVAVRAGDRVRQGDVLFQLDSREAEAALAAARADLATARAAAAARRVALADERQRLSLYRAVDDARAVSTDEVQRRSFAERRAQADLGQAEASIAAANAAIAVRQTALDRLTVRAPITGRIYRVNVRTGEFAAAGPTSLPLMTIGADDRLHVRVEIDEADSARFNPQSPAYGVVRGRADQRIPLRFVRAEPQLVEKRALSGGSERVDTRVVEVIYSFDPKATAVWLGQRMDVYVRGGNPDQTGKAVS